MNLNYPSLPFADVFNQLSFSCRQGEGQVSGQIFGASPGTASIVWGASLAS